MKFTKQYYEIKDGIAYVYDSKGICFMIDSIDIDLLSNFDARWNCFTTGRSAGKYYVSTRKGNKTIYLHRFLLGLAGSKKQVDHIDGNPLNNCRSNLRTVTDAENKQNRHKIDSRNKSGYRGVFWNSQQQKWSAKIQVKGKQYHVGHFVDIHEAGKAVAEARRQLMTHSNEANSEKITEWKPLVGRESGSKSGVHGVCWDKRSGKWMAIATKNRKNVYIGKFGTIEEAKAAYDSYKESLI